MLRAAGAAFHVFLALLFDRDAHRSLGDIKFPLKSQVATGGITAVFPGETLLQFLTARPGTFHYDGAVFRSAISSYRQDRTFTPSAQTHLVSALFMALLQPRRHAVPFVVKSLQRRRSLFPFLSFLSFFSFLSFLSVLSFFSFFFSSLWPRADFILLTRRQFVG